MAEVTTTLSASGIAICSCVVSKIIICWLISLVPRAQNSKSCSVIDQAEIDGGRGMAVMLFHVECDVDNLVLYRTSISHYNQHLCYSFSHVTWFLLDFFYTQVNACSSIDAILGVLGWSTGCSWSTSTDIPECWKVNGTKQPTSSFGMKFCPFEIDEMRGCS